MKRIPHLRIFIASLAMIGIAGPVSNSIRRVHAQSDPNIEGTWSVNVTFDGGVVPTFRSLESFNAGGTMIQSSSAGDKSNQGVWRKTGGRTFIYTFEGFQFDPAGTFLGTLKVRENAQFDQGSDSYTGVGSIEFRNPEGSLVESFCARTRATRMVAEPASCQ